MSVKVTPFLLLMLLGSFVVAGEAENEVARLETVAAALDVGLQFQKESFRVKMTHGPITGHAVGEKHLQQYSRLLSRELALYTAEILKKARVKRIVVCSGLKYDGQTRNAVPDYEHATLYLEAVGGMYAIDYMRKCIHHELFHMVDYFDDGKLYDDPEWKRLNPPGFSYGPGGAAVQENRHASLPQFAKAGFLNDYSMAGVEEDKAEVFAHLMADAPALNERCQRDPVLAKKAERIKTLCEKFCAHMNGVYWDGVAKKQQTNK